MLGLIKADYGASKRLLLHDILLLTCGRVKLEDRLRGQRGVSEIVDHALREVFVLLITYSRFIFLRKSLFVRLLLDQVTITEWFLVEGLS